MNKQKFEALARFILHAVGKEDIGQLFYSDGVVWMSLAIETGWMQVNRSGEQGECLGHILQVTNGGYHTWGIGPDSWEYFFNHLQDLATSIILREGKQDVSV